MGLLDRVKSALGGRGDDEEEPLHGAGPVPPE
jgi:hypothetical protein